MSLFGRIGRTLLAAALAIGIAAPAMAKTGRHHSHGRHASHHAHANVGGLPKAKAPAA